jgi:hypothetical protein
VIEIGITRDASRFNNKLFNLYSARIQSLFIMYAHSTLDIGLAKNTTGGSGFDLLKMNIHPAFI